MKKPNSLQKLFSLLDKREQRQTWIILGLTLVTGFAQAVGVFSVFPFLNVALNPSQIQENDILRFLYEFFGFTRGLYFLIFLGIVVFLALLFSNGITTLTIYAKLRFSQMRNHSISSRLLEHYMKNDYQFYTSRNSSDLVKNVIQEVTQLIGYLMSFFDLVVNASILSFILATILIIDFQTSLTAALLFGSVYVLLTVYFVKQYDAKVKNATPQTKTAFALRPKDSIVIKQPKLWELKTITYQTIKPIP
jgi:ABC-type bacteriocin/lantibiotic exporters, contain an N-terminal double-glycine peptidase domain